MSGRHSSASAAPAHADSAIDALAALIAWAARDDELGAALAAAGTTVHVRCAESPHPGLTLVLDGAPIEAVEGRGGDPDGLVELAAGDLEQLCEGRLRLALAILDGRAGYRGEVRRFLRVLPILRRAAIEFHEARA